MLVVGVGASATSAEAVEGRDAQRGGEVAVAATAGRSLGELQAELAKRYEPPLATGENLFSYQDARNLLRYGGMRPDRDVLQFDCALSYGLVEYLRTLEVLREQGWSWRRVVPHGGHQMSLNIAAGLGLGGNESYPGIFQPFGGFADSLPIEDGYARLPDAPARRPQSPRFTASPHTS